MFEAHYHYAGWFTLDVRVLGTMMLFAASLGVLVLALWGKGRRWDEHVVGFLAVFALSLASVWLVTNAAGAPTPIHIETMFPVP